MSQDGSCCQKHLGLLKNVTGSNFSFFRFPFEVLGAFLSKKSKADADNKNSLDEWKTTSAGSQPVPLWCSGIECHVYIRVCVYLNIIYT